MDQNRKESGGDKCHEIFLFLFLHLWHNLYGKEIIGVEYVEPVRG
jgi:hypothetical protein